MNELTISVCEVHGFASAEKLKKVVQDIGGVTSVTLTLDLGSSSALLRVNWYGNVVKPNQIERAIVNSGFTVSDPNEKHRFKLQLTGIGRLC